MNELNCDRTLCLDGAVLHAVSTTSGRLADAPLTAQAMLCLDLFERAGHNLLWLAADAREMVHLHESVRTLQRNRGQLSQTPFLFQPLDKDPAVFGEHLQLAQHLAEKKDFILITCPQALECRLPSAEWAIQTVRTLAVGETHQLAELTDWMADAGYQFGVEVYLQGEAALRGGILDVWPHGSPRPVRLEFFGNEIDSIRLFDDQTQCSIAKVEQIALPQIRTELEERSSAQLLDLLPDNTFLVSYGQLLDHDDPNADFWNAGGYGPLAEALDRPSSGEPFRARAPSIITLPYDFYETGLQSVSPDTLPAETELARRAFVTDRCEDPDWTALFFFETTGTMSRFKELYGDLEGFDRLILKQGVLHDSAVNAERQILLIAERDFYAYHTNRSAHARTSKRWKKQERINEAADIQPGDYVVHVEHGVGKYLGIVETSFSGRSAEVLAIEYAKGEKVYLPVTQAHLLTRYKGMGKHTPKPHTLGGKKWHRDRDGANEAIRDLAANLLQIQAERELQQGHAFSKDTPWQTEFEAAFPYIETPDQLTASEEIKQDMERSRPMDRLLCGDVGFGKTEVALRAAFKAVMDGTQVAVLVPTTVLAQQHYDSFIERMAAFPVRVDMVSRFRSRARQNKTIAAAAAGEVDILIGTHRLLSKDVRFHNLGLVIIDEEQRFGVEDKEHLKELRKQVDVITMSATPIPRTLYMSMTGVRDLSTIKTAPQERQPIDTHVIGYDEEIITEAIRLELQREGQIFYLHNRVKTIHIAEKRLKELVPEARIAVAHGQMGEKELSEIMHAFVQGRFDLLLCTTIIESGVDIPNCNTLIIENAERFGLSELYQLRGRVGRSNHKAFAYMMLSPGGNLISTAQDRMNAIKRYTGLGSGFRLALRDLELRGAGNLLGAKQSGHISAIGFDLYCQLLKRTILMMQGKTPPPLMEVVVKLDFLDHSPKTGTKATGAYIPYSYIEDENLRLRLYQRISAIADHDEIPPMKEEIKDRFGKIPEELHRLFHIAEIRILGARHKLDSIIVRDSKVMLNRGKEYLTHNNRHPRLTEKTTSAQLKQLTQIIRNMA